MGSSPSPSNTHASSHSDPLLFQFVHHKHFLGLSFAILVKAVNFTGLQSNLSEVVCFDTHLLNYTSCVPLYQYVTGNFLGNFTGYYAGLNTATLSIKTSHPNGTNHAQWPFDLLCQWLVDSDHPTKVELPVIWDNCIPHTQPFNIREKENLFIWMRVPWDNDSMSPDNFFYRRSNQMNRSIFGIWPLCRHHACMDISPPLLFIQGGNYYNGNFRDNKSFEESVQITPKQISPSMPHQFVSTPLFLFTNQCYYNKLKLNLKSLHVECLLKMW